MIACRKTDGSAIDSIFNAKKSPAFAAGYFYACVIHNLYLCTKFYCWRRDSISGQSVAGGLDVCMIYG